MTHELPPGLLGRTSLVVRRATERISHASPDLTTRGEGEYNLPVAVDRCLRDIDHSLEERTAASARDIPETVPTGRVLWSIDDFEGVRAARGEGRRR